MNSVISNFNRVRIATRPENIFNSVDTWVWGPKIKRDYNSYMTRENAPTIKNRSRFALLFLIGTGLLFMIGVGIVWIVDNRTHWLWGITGVPLMWWIAWTVWPDRRANCKH